MGEPRSDQCLIRAPLVGGIFPPPLRFLRPQGQTAAEQAEQQAQRRLAAARERAQVDRERSVADLETAIANTEESIATLADEIAALNAGIAALDKSVAEATEQRKAENEEFTELIAQDSAAKEVISFAKNRHRVPRVFVIGHFNSMSRCK